MKGPLYRAFLKRHGFLGFNYFRYSSGSIGYRAVLAENDRGILIFPKRAAHTAFTAKNFLDERNSQYGA